MTTTAPRHSFPFAKIFFSIALAFAMRCLAADEISLFDGKTLDGWKEVDFAGKGKIAIKTNGVLEIGAGDELTGLVYTKKPVRQNYELTLEGRRTMGSDFFCGLTFPVATNSCTLILGGWGGSLTGISSFDGLDASENQFSSSVEYEMNRWYKIRIRVTPEKIDAWLDDKQIIKAPIEEHRLGMRGGDIEMCVPLGVATWQTRGELRNIKLRKLDEPK